jgi:hypothetical protein
MRILCRGTDGTPHTCKPLKLRPFASAGSCWPREELSPHDNALRYAHDQGLDFQGLRLSHAADSRKRSVSIKGRFDEAVMQSVVENRVINELHL